MKNWIKNIINGIGDIILPPVGKTLSRDEKNQVEINYARLTAQALTYILLIALFKGWITFASALEFFKILITGASQI